MMKLFIWDLQRKINRVLAILTMKIKACMIVPILFKESSHVQST